MIRKLTPIFVASLVAVAAAQDSPSPTPRPALPQPPSVNFYYAGPGVTAPALLSSSLSISSPLRNCDRYIGMVKLSAVIDENGMPHSVNMVSGDARLANVAIGILEEERFRPGTYYGAPAPVAVQATIGMQTCSRPIKNSDEGDPDEFILCAHPFIAMSLRARP